MSGAAFILVINLLVAGLFCATFVALACHDHERTSARWFGACYAFGAVNLLIEALVPVMTHTSLAVFLAHGAFVAALLCLNVGVARHHGVEAPRTLLAGVLAVSLVLAAYVVDLPRDTILRMTLFQTPFCIMQLIGAAIVLRSPRKSAFDRPLAVLLAFSGFHFMSKPLISMAFGGPGSTAQDYLGTTYALFSHSMAAILAITTAVLLLTMLITDVLRDAARKSETDPLTGLYNRRGFERRLAEIVSSRAADGVPVAMVFCDLDHFKHVNDTFGHAVGDRLIAEFARAMLGAAGKENLLGRIGGEEFAAVLPGGNSATGRLFAEAVRAAYGRAAATHVPPDIICSASFGVAEFQRADTASTMMERADAALYKAKRDGRDRVRIASPAVPAHQRVESGEGQRTLAG